MRDRAAVRRRIGLVFQDPTLDAPMSGEQNLRFHQELYGVDRRRAPARREEVLRMVGLWDRRADPVADLLRRHAAAARDRARPAALAAGALPRRADDRPRPADPRHRSGTTSRELHRTEEITVFVTTHYMDEAEHCDRIAIMNEGRIVALDTPDALKAQVGADRVTITTDDDEAALRALRDRVRPRGRRARGRGDDRAWPTARASCRACSTVSAATA